MELEDSELSFCGSQRKLFYKNILVNEYNKNFTIISSKLIKLKNCINYFKLKFLWQLQWMGFDIFLPFPSNLLAAFKFPSLTASVSSVK